MVGIHFTWKPNIEAIQFPLILLQNTLEPFNYRVHYGKLFFETDKLLSDFAPDLIKLQELASKYESVKKTEVVDEETGIKTIKETVIKPNRFANCWTDGVVYNRGADTDCSFKTNAKIYSQEKME